MESTSDPYQLTDLVEEIASICKTSFTELVELFHTMYDMSDNKIPHVKERIIEHFKQFCHDILEQQMDRKRELLDLLESLDKERLSLMKQLELEIKINPVLNSLPLQTQIDQRRAILKEYKVIWENRMAGFKQQIEQEAAICAFIGEDRFNISHDELPSEMDSCAFNFHLEGLKHTKRVRMEWFNKIKQSVNDKLRLLESDPDNDILENLLNEEPRNLTQGYLHLLQEEETRLERKVATSKLEAQELLERLEYLWKRVEESPEIQTKFLSLHSLYGEGTIKQISKEVKKYEIILRNNLESIIMTVRQATEELWEKLTYTELQKETLREAFDENYTEQALLEHEQLLSSLEATFKKYQSLFELASQRQALWERMCHLEELATDKTRLNNRGGRLLQEERERKTISDKLPKIEKRIHDLLLRFKKEEGKTFLWYGKDLAAKIESDWATLAAEKENRKLKGGGDLGYSPALLMRTPTKRNCDLSCSSISSYSEFQSKIDKASEGQDWPVLSDVNVRHSSPVNDEPCRSHPVSASDSTPISKHACTPSTRRTPRTPCTGGSSSTKRKIPPSPHPKYFIPYSKADRFKF